MLSAEEQDWVGRLVEAARAGELLDLAPEVPDSELDAGGAARWPAERYLPAAALRAALLSPNLAADPLGLRVRGVYLTGILNLDHATISCPIMLTYSALQHPASIQAATLVALNLSHTHLPGLDLDATITGKADLDLNTSPSPARSARSARTSVGNSPCPAPGSPTPPAPPSASMTPGSTAAPS